MRREEFVIADITKMRHFANAALIDAGLDADVAALVAEVQLEASIRGQPTHNVGDIPLYAEHIRSGYVNAYPIMQTITESDSHLKLDADCGPGQWAACIAMKRAIEIARRGGMAIVTVQNSRHYGASGYYASMAADAGMIGMCTTNAGATVAPWGSKEKMLGNNPLGFACPTGGAHPFMLDIAMSVVAAGKVGLRLAQGKEVPLGWLLDKNGRPTTDPSALGEGGSLHPIADHKGYGLATIMEILSGVLSGSKFGADHTRANSSKPGQTEDIGHFFFVINPAIFMPIEDFTGRMDKLVDDLTGADLIDQSGRVVIPGSFEYEARDRNVAKGTVPIIRETYEKILKFSEDYGIAIDGA